ncbi:ATP-binding cassette domain-containing protein, partial [Paraburkholderia sp.]|uniref:ATP-binding cassette domain-containing protein n=1 Tax=Paraburkholderia sp. TaxID=1926495 RepID=UPI00286F8867
MNAVVSPAPAPVLSLEGIGKRFGAFQALDEVSIDLMAGDVHCLLGENGAGKSTLCNVIFGVHQPDAGAMRMNGVTYRPRNPREAIEHGIAMVHQHFSLVDDASVLDNLLLGQARGRIDRAREAQRVEATLARVGLTLPLDARIADLSVGERQRVEIVKCLMREPRLLLLD